MTNPPPPVVNSPLVVPVPSVMPPPVSKWHAPPALPSTVPPVSALWASPAALLGMTRPTHGLVAAIPSKITAVPRLPRVPRMAAPLSLWKVPAPSTATLAGTRSPLTPFVVLVLTTTLAVVSGPTRPSVPWSPITARPPPGLRTSPRKLPAPSSVRPPLTLSALKVTMRTCRSVWLVPTTMPVPVSGPPPLPALLPRTTVPP